MSTSFTASREELLKGLTAIASVVPKQPQRDILKCVKIKANQGTSDSLSLSATDLESYVVYEVNTNVLVQNNGEFVVPFLTFFEYVKSLESETITIRQQSEESLKLNETGTDMEVGLQDLAEFPQFPSIPAGKKDWAQLPINAIDQVLSLTVFAVADKGSPKWGALSALQVLFEKDKISFIGTDTHRASLAQMQLDGQAINGSYLVSAEAVASLTKIFSSDMAVSPNAPNNVIFKNDNCTLFLRLMSGDFPDVRKIFSGNNHQQNVSLTVPDFLKQVKKVVLAVDQHNTIRIEIKEDKIHLITKTKEQRKNIKVEYAIAYKGNGIQFAINSKYLADLLKAADSDEPLKMQFNRSNQALVLTQQNFYHLLMPQEVK